MSNYPLMESHSRYGSNFLLINTPPMVKACTTCESLVFLPQNIHLTDAVITRLLHKSQPMSICLYPHCGFVLQAKQYNSPQKQSWILLSFLYQYLEVSKQQPRPWLLCMNFWADMLLNLHNSKYLTFQNLKFPPSSLKRT